jgi:hypothetical protein
MSQSDKHSNSEFQQREVSFVSDVHLIQVLGEQLIGSEKVGILELIKNAYDAGASLCQVWIEKIPGLREVDLSDPVIANLPGPVITIIDNGSGMDERTITEGWLRPASRMKTSIKERLKHERIQADARGTRSEYEALVTNLKREHGGRLPLGEKGVGRFAAHRLGRYLTLQTKSANEKWESTLKIDWDDFDPPTTRPVDLETIRFPLISRNPTRDYGSTQSGTMLRIYGGRPGFDWTEEKLNEIGQAIAHLRPPHIRSLKKEPQQAQNGFKVEFHCPQLATEYEPLTDTVPAPFLCTAIVDEEGKAEIEIQFVPPASLSIPLTPQIWPDPHTQTKPELIDLRTRPPQDNENYWKLGKDKVGLRRPSCGPFTMEIRFWFRRKEWIDYADWKEFTEYPSDLT